MRRQTKLIIQGFPGSFHDVAARQYFGEHHMQAIPANSFNELAERLRDDQSINYGVMAIENSIAGSILQNYRILREYDFWISGELYLRISHDLMALPDQELSDIHTVQSHPMALYQCLPFLNQHPHIKLVESEDTALSAKEISEKGLQGIAAIGSSVLADIYGLHAVAKEIETSKVNYTRFVIVSRQPEYATMGNADKASIYLRVSHHKGSLLKVIQAIAAHNINISKLQSFPVLGKVNEYYFHLDLEFDHISQYENCISDLKHVSFGFDELGIYKKAIIYDHQAIH